MIEFELPAARVVFTTRDGGVSDGPYRSLNLGAGTGDDVGRVRENRRRLVDRLGVPIALSGQVHGADIRDWSAPEPTFLDPPTPHRADGHTTNVRALGLLVIVADCLPVALVAPGRVAMLHCGWRGLAAGIIQRAVERFDEPPLAIVGPGIGPCCYEVGDEVLDAFADVPSLARMLDLRAVAHHKLEASGVDQIMDVDLCTSCHPELFFSHRRDGGMTGRQAGIAWLT